MIDTGASRSSISRDLAEQIGARRVAGAAAIRPQGVGSEQRKAWPAEIDSFAIGEETVKSPTLLVLDRKRGPNSSMTVLLGQDFLRSHRVLIARSQQRVYVSYVGGTVFMETAP
jgi:predicted aspartyl protease